MPLSPSLIRLEVALADFKQRVPESNRLFFEGKIRALEQDQSLTNRQRLDKLAPYFNLAKWSNNGYGSSITSPSSILLRKGDPGYIKLPLDSDCVSPPEASEVRESYLHELQRMVNEVCAMSLKKPIPRLPHEGHVELPNEFRHFVSLTNGVWDYDFRQGTCGIHGTFFDRPPLRNEMSDWLLDEELWRRQGWTVLTGWRCGLGDDGASTSILYAMNPTSSCPSDREWAWRVTHNEPGSDHGVWFDSIADFLTFLADWPARLPTGWQSQFLQPPDYTSAEEDYCSDDDEPDDLHTACDSIYL